MAHLLFPQWRTEVGNNTLLYRASHIKTHWRDPEYSHCPAGRAKKLHWQQQARVECSLLSTKQLFEFICWQDQDHLFCSGYLTLFVKHRSPFFFLTKFPSLHKQLNILYMLNLFSGCSLAQRQSVSQQQPRLLNGIRFINFHRFNIANYTVKLQKLGFKKAQKLTQMYHLKSQAVCSWITA